MEKPLPAYSGREPFVFVCYSHSDNGVVYPEVLRLQRQGFRLWYDEGITPGSEWSEAIARAIETCEVFLYFITPNAVSSEHCRREVNFALEQQCAMLAVHLLRTDVPSALRLSLSHRQAILKYDLTRDRYEGRLDNALRDAAAGRDGNGDEIRSLRIGDFVLDIASQRLLRRDESHLLDPKDISVLLHLVEAAPALVSTEALLNRSWPGLVVGDNVVHQVIGRLRKALGDNARHPSYIETLPRRGYRLLHAAVPIEGPQGGVAIEEPPGGEEAATGAARRAADNRRPVLMIAVACLLAIAAFAAGSYLWTGSGATDPRSFAVLPLENLTPGEDLRGLDDGITTELYLGLQNGQGFRIAPLSSALRFRGATSSVREIAAELGVANVVAGTIRKSGERIRVTFELISAGAEDLAWTGLYERELGEGFQAEKDIGESAARDMLAEFDPDSPVLRFSRPEADTAVAAKPSLQEIFGERRDAGAAADYPALEDVDIASMEDLGDVR